jgi:hypothetical protein
MSLYNIHDNHPYMYSKTVSLCQDNYSVTPIFLLRYIMLYLDIYVGCNHSSKLYTQTHTIWIFGISIHKIHYITTHWVWKFPHILIQEYNLNRHTKIDNKSCHLRKCNTLKTTSVCEILWRPCYTTQCFYSTFPQLMAY